MLVSIYIPRSEGGVYKHSLDITKQVSVYDEILSDVCASCEIERRENQRDMSNNSTHYGTSTLWGFDTEGF
jgi:hypothetical protein